MLDSYILLTLFSLIEPAYRKDHRVRSSFVIHFSKAKKREKMMIHHNENIAHNDLTKWKKYNSKKSILSKEQKIK